MKSAVLAATADTPGSTDESNLERIKQVAGLGGSGVGEVMGVPQIPSPCAPHLQELLEEVRRELQKMKEEIIKGGGGHRTRGGNRALRGWGSMGGGNWGTHP